MVIKCGKFHHMTDKKISTKIVQAGIAQDKTYNAVIPPLHLSSTHKMQGFNNFPAYQYSRVRNPTRDTLVDALTDLEGGDNGCVTASGMASITLILNLLKPDDLLIAPYDCYGRAYRLMCALSEKGHFKLEFVDQYHDKAAEEIASKKPRMVFIESPSNPVMRIADIKSIADACKTSRADCLIVCDNTFLSPILQRPIELGADIVTHSTTKFLNGHSDVVGGAVVAKTKETWEELDFWANSLGLIGAPFDSYMTLRGLRTLKLRVEQAQENAGQIVQMLENHTNIETVFYPGLENHPHYTLAKSQQDGFGAMISFTLNTDEAGCSRFIDNLEIFTLAQSLGGTESLINHPATMTHVSMGQEARTKAGVSDNLFRISVGIEDGEDLVNDLEKALNTI